MNSRKKDFLSFIKGLTILAVIAAIATIAIQLLWPGILPGTTWLLFGYNYGFTILVHVALLMAVSEKSELMISFTLGAIVAKLFINAIFIIAVAYFNMDQAMSVVFTFFAYYILFGIAEIIAVIKHIKASHIPADQGIK